MKTKSAHLGKNLKAIGLTLALAASGFSLPAAAPPRTIAFRAAQSSYSIIGKKVVNTREKTLGTVTDLGIDLENGRLVEVIVSSPSGFLGLGQRTVAVPPGALVYDLQNGVMRLDMEKDLFKVAPKINWANWAEHTQITHVSEAYRYFAQEPYFAADGEGSPFGNTSLEPLGYVQRVSKLGLPVKNLQGEELGRVNSVQFDLATGIVSHIIVQAPGFTQPMDTSSVQAPGFSQTMSTSSGGVTRRRIVQGPGVFQTMTVIQPQALKFNAARDGLLLDVSKQAFKDEPRFKSTFARKGEFQQESFVNRTVAANDGVNTKQNVRDDIASTYTPLAQGTTFRDVDKTYRIYAAMREDASLSKTAQNVEVGTLNDRTTLRGNVNTAEEKRIIGEIAASVGLPENVSNLLEVRPSPETN